MNTRHAFAAAALMLLGSVGCIPSANPIFTQDQIVFDADLLGTWMDEEDGVRLEFARRTENSYSLTYTPKKGGPLKYVAHIAEVQGQRFLDVFPDSEIARGKGLESVHFVPLHLIFRLQQTSPTLVAYSADWRWLERQMKAGSEINAVSFSGREVITSSTKDLQSFLLRHLDRFTAKSELKRR